MDYGFPYQDLDVDVVRCSERRTYSGGEEYDLSFFATTVPLSGGRVAVTFCSMHRATPGDDELMDFEVVICAGVTITGRFRVAFPVRLGELVIQSYGVSVVQAGDYVVMGSPLSVHDGVTPLGSRTYWGGQWLLLIDCSGDTPVLADEYLRETTGAPGGGSPPEAEVDITLSPMDDSRVAVTMLSPDSGIAVSTLFHIDVSGGSLAFQDNGYPLTTGATYFGDAYDKRLGYSQGVGIFGSDNPYTFGFSINTNQNDITFGASPPGWTFGGESWYLWGGQGQFVSSVEQGVFYAPVYQSPNDYTGNPVFTGKFQYTGSGFVELVDVSPPVPADHWAAVAIWINSHTAFWSGVEYQGKVVTAAPSYYLGDEQLWLMNDSFGASALYRVANLSNQGVDVEPSLCVSGGRLYMGANLAVDPPAAYLIDPDEFEGIAVVLTVINFNQPDIDGELTERRRKFWRSRPGW